MVAINVMGYVRVSTQRQAEEGYSLAEQEDRIRAYCEVQGWKLVNIYRDEGISGATVDEEELVVSRPGIQDLLANVEENCVKYVVVTETSRLWRSDLSRVLIQQELRRRKADVRAISNESYSIETDADHPAEGFKNRIMEALDDYERVMIAFRLKLGRRKKASTGAYAGGRPPLGYVALGKKLHVDPEKAPTVLRIFALRSENPGWKMEELADRLNAEGHRLKSGRRFYGMDVWRALQRERFYRGKYVYGGVQADGEHEAILKETPVAKEERRPEERPVRSSVQTMRYFGG